MTVESATPMDLCSALLACEHKFLNRRGEVDWMLMRNTARDTFDLYLAMRKELRQRGIKLP